MILLIGSKKLSVVDLGCGTGAIGLAIAKHCTNTTVTVLIKRKSNRPYATKRALKQLQRSGATRSFEGVGQAFDMVVCNPPYIQRGTPLPPSVRLWEDPRALHTNDIEPFQRVLNFHPQHIDPLLPRFVFECGGESRQAKSKRMLKPWDT